MNLKIIQAALSALKSISDLSQKVIDAGDPEKYANSVQTLNQGVDDTYTQMREVIMKSEKFSEEEKLERLQDLAVREAEAKRMCGEAIKGNREHVSKVVLEVFKGFLTCGISFTPAIVKQIQNMIGKGKDIPKLETEIQIGE